MSEDDLVTVCQFRTYDVASDGFRTSRRWGTQEAIGALRSAEIIPDTGVRVPAKAVQSDIEGLTERGFNPNTHPSGFQTRITS